MAQTHIGGKHATLPTMPLKHPHRMFPPGLEPGTFRVLGERDNHYTTETDAENTATGCSLEGVSFETTSSAASNVAML